MNCTTEDYFVNSTFMMSSPGELNLYYAAFEVLVAIFAVVGNAMVIFVFRKERKLRRRTNYYIVSLAAADFLVGLLGIPFAIMASVGLPSNLYACLFTVSLLVVLCTISIFCLVAVSVDRYWAILHPMGYSRNVRTRTALGYGHEQLGKGAFLKSRAIKALSEIQTAGNLNDIVSEVDIRSTLETMRRTHTENELQDHTSKPLHGQYYRILEEQKASKVLKFAFLKSSTLRSETESYIIAAQDGVINTLDNFSRNQDSLAKREETKCKKEEIRYYIELEAEEQRNSGSGTVTKKNSEDEGCNHESEVDSESRKNAPS
ncbi:olfactory receptor and adenosine receptor [Holotrichia oblita]|uniref:Olfactory receptor and adenosine receptor n=1 Tax=Holotrichia oblita TaxID=644536 RepID=A0ACB9T5U0_HOLOL|nr:olfactory receptor and adenosine receptor [Holotrichia oblita]